MDNCRPYSLWFIRFFYRVPFIHNPYSYNVIVGIRNICLNDIMILLMNNYQKEMAKIINCWYFPLTNT